MKGGQDHVAGEGGFDGDDRSLFVADLSDQDDVGIGAEDRLQGRGKGQAGFDVELDLVDPFELQLDRVLDGDDVLLR